MYVLLLLLKQFEKDENVIYLNKSFLPLKNAKETKTASYKGVLGIHCFGRKQ